MSSGPGIRRCSLILLTDRTLSEGTSAHSWPVSLGQIPLWGTVLEFGGQTVTAESIPVSTVSLKVAVAFSKAGPLGHGGDLGRH